MFATKQNLDRNPGALGRRNKPITLVITILITFLGLSLPSSSNALVTVPDLFWITNNTVKTASNGGYGTGTVVASSPATWRFIATDVSYLYFFDGANFPTQELVRTKLDGTQRTVLTSVNNPSGITITGDNILYSLWGGGVYVISKSSPGTPIQIDSNTRTSIQSITSSGNDIFYLIAGRIYHGVLNGTTPITFTQNSPVTNVSSALYSDNSGILYATGPNNSGQIYSISAASWNEPLVNWRALDVSSITANPWGLAVQGSVIYFTNGLGGVGKITNSGGGLATVHTSGSSSYGIVTVPAEFTVTYQANGGTGTLMGPETSRLPINLAPLTYSKTGYQFGGWLSGTGEIFNNESTYDLGINATLTAQWVGDPHVVHYNSQSGSAVADGTFPTGGTLTLASAPTRTGYTFNGWFAAAAGGAALSSPYTPGVTTDITLYAQWTADSHVVTYNSDGGSSVATGSFTSGGSMSLPSTPSKSGYTFSGWFTSPSGGTALSSPYSPPGTSDITLYAQWRADPQGSGLPNTGSHTGSFLDFASVSIASGAALIAFGMRRRRKR
jgi:uncharacterized repeat protein (TIGR02543 family)